MITTPEVVASPFSWVGDAGTVLRQVAEIGYEAVELQTRDPRAFDTGEFRKQARAAGLAIAGVSTAPAVSEDDLYLTSPDAEIREETVRRLKLVLEFAAECETHATIGRIRGFAKWAPRREIGLDWLNAALHELVERAEELGVRLVIEPQTRQVTDMFNTIGSALEFIEAFGSPVLAIEADAYHMALEERSIPGALVQAQLSKRLLHVQISDSNRLAPGWGHLNWVDFFATLEALGYSRWISIEASQEPNSEAAARQSFQFVSLISSAYSST